MSGEHEQNVPMRVTKGAWFNACHIVCAIWNGREIPLALYYKSWHRETAATVEIHRANGALDRLRSPSVIDLQALLEKVTADGAKVVILNPSVIFDEPLLSVIRANSARVRIVDRGLFADAVADYFGAVNHALVSETDSGSTETAAVISSGTADDAPVAANDIRAIETAAVVSTGRANATNREWLLPYLDDEGFLVIRQAWDAQITDGYLEME